MFACRAAPRWALLREPPSAPVTPACAVQALVLLHTSSRAHHDAPHRDDPAAATGDASSLSSPAVHHAARAAQLNAAVKQVARLLRALPHASVLVVGQAHSYVAQVFDLVDTVVKEGGCAAVEEQRGGG